MIRKFSKLSYKHHPGQVPLRYQTIGQLLEQKANEFNERICIISKHQNNKCVTFKEILENSDRLAAGLLAFGLKKNDRVGLWAPNSIEWYTTKMACARAGFILATLNLAHVAPEIEYCINKVGLKVLICGDRLRNTDYYYTEMQKIIPTLQKNKLKKLKSPKIPTLNALISFSKEEKKGVFGYEEILDMATTYLIQSIRKNQNDIQSDDPFNIQFTSGTTGKPKAAVLSHFHMINNSFYVGKGNELDKKPHKICVQVPFFHAFGTISSILAPLHYGATLVLPSDTYNPSKSLDAIYQEKCTIIYGTPTMYVDLIKKQMEMNLDINPDIALTGGALCTPHLFRQILDVLKVKKIKSIYGLTEATAVIFQTLPSDEEDQITNTVGYLSDHLEVKVVDKDNKIVPFGQPGELCVRGYSIMLNYWNDKEKIEEIIGIDKWMRTGDQFVLEEDGYGRIIGRLKEMIIRGGENIYPKEIEELLMTHPKILEVYVIGLPHERLGEEICACIRIKDNTTITLNEIRQFCHDRLSYFKIPSQFEIFKQFPKTASGKIQKFKIIEQIKTKIFINKDL